MPELHAYLKTKFPELIELFALADKEDNTNQRLKARLRGQIFMRLIPTRQKWAQTKVTYTEVTYHATDGHPLTGRLYQPSTASNPQQRLLILIHGGGMTRGSVSGFDLTTKQLVEATGLPIFVVDYRLAPQASAKKIVADVYTGVKWAYHHANAWHLDPQQLILVGISSGGALSMGVTLLARKDKLPIAKQMLIYPMLDDDTVIPQPELVGKVSWTYAMNKNSWQTYLGDDFGQPNVSSILVPAHEDNFKALPPTYIDVGTCDIFYQENVTLAEKLRLAGVPVILHTYPGLPHNFEKYTPAPYLKSIMQHRIAFLRN